MKIKLQIFKSQDYNGYFIREGKSGYALEYFFTLWGAKRGLKKWRKRLNITPKDDIVIYEER